MNFLRLLLISVWAFGFVARSSAAHSIARIWDEQILSSIRIDTPHPPVQARNLFSLSVCMYDAWAAYDTNSVGYIYHEKHTAADVAAARREAISYAAYRILQERYALSKSPVATLAALDARMASLGYDTNNFSFDPATPAGVGHLVYAAVSGFFIYDGARQTEAYTDFPTNQGGYFPVNLALITGAPGTMAVDVNRWQPLAITNATDQNGFPADLIQKFIGAQWLGVRPFALDRGDSTQPWFNPGPQPRLNGVGDAQFRNEVVEIIRRSSELAPDDGVMIDISPGAFGNNSLGTNDGAGYPMNPATGLPYASNLVKRGDFARVLAEFWADGPTSETPPGHWNTLANGVSDYPGFQKRIGGGTNVLVDDLEWDVKVYFALNAAVHDAACAAWALKRFYDGGRPIEFIRYMGQLGQCSQAGLTYHVDGLPLVSNLIEIVTPATAQVGGRHSGLPTNAIAIFSWPGQPSNPTNQYSGARWIEARNWMPYQRANFVTPAFPGYVSGHSAFSRAAAEVLTAMTGSAFFPGGMGTYNAPSNTFLSFEKGPSQSLQLQWGTYYDAADQAGLSRLWGGIHVSADDLTGRKVGALCGQNVWQLAQKYFDGSITNVRPMLSMQFVGANQSQLRFNTLRGFYYKLQSTTNLNHPFTDEPAGFFHAADTSMTVDDGLSASKKFYRVVRSGSP